MQPGLMNLLLGIPANGASPLAAGDSAGAGVGGDSFAQMFSQLLSEPGVQGEAGPGEVSGSLPVDLTPSALMAQEVDAPLHMLMQQEVTPEDAAEIIRKIDLMIGSGQGQGKGDAWQQLKAALQPVADGEEPATLASILEQMPEDTALPDMSEIQADGDDHPTALMRMLCWVRQAIDTKKKEIAVQTDVEEASVAVLNNGLQAIMFRTDDRADQAPAAAKKKAEEITAAHLLPQQLVVEMTPLNNQQAVTPEWLAAMIYDQQNASLDEAIAPLELTGEDALPLVTLPAGTPTAADDALASQLTADADTDLAMATLRTESHDAAGEATDSEARHTRTESWLKNLPFPLKVSDDSAAHAPAAMADMVELAPLPDTANAKELRPMAPLRESAVSDKQPDTTLDHSLVVTSAPPTVYTRSHATPYVATPHQPLVHTPPADQVQVAIRNASADGIDRITIQLDPVDLGRVEVKMNTGADGRTHIVFTADRSATLDILSRDAHGLERSLAESGIKADAGSMEFNLRQQPQFVQPETNGQGGGQRHSANDDEQPPTIAPLSALDVPVRHLTLNVSGGVDIQA